VRRFVGVNAASYGVFLKASLPHPPRQTCHPRRAERGSGNFVSGFVLGGVVCGVLGFVFAPQISRALLGEDQRIRLPRFMEEAELDPEVTKQNLAEKIAQLNAAIDDVSAQLRSQESEETTTAA